MVQFSTINVLFSLHALLIKIPVEMEFPDGEIEFFRTVRTVRFIVLFCFVLFCLDIFVVLVHYVVFLLTYFGGRAHRYMLATAVFIISTVFTELYACNRL